MKSLESAIKESTVSGLKFEGLHFEFNDQSDHMAYYDQILKKNQQERRPLQGMYPMDVQELFQKEIFIPKLELQYLVPNDQNNLPDEAYMNDLETLIKEFLNKKPLPNGLYAVEIAQYKEDKLVRKGVYYVRMNNHQVVEFLKDLS
ncbi:hypothetical protein [Streptococcus sp. DD13]|uniref:hypothetical protein n=1 Tax=Streptococcus sp. DD13 TaxID=1777881 RepID=UPI001E385DFE|nr:hypothetical protein [Streptococcus sp. DD13]